VLKALAAALGGAKHAPEDPVRHGAKKAQIVADLEDIVVTRTFTPKGTELVVKGKDGSVFPSPQAMLDSLVSSSSYDCLDFVRQPGKSPADAARAQAATLRKLVNLDFTMQDAKRKEAFDARTEVTRDLKRLQARLDQMPDVDAGDDEDEVSVAELAAELKKRQALNSAKVDKARDLDRLREKARAASDIIEDLDLKLKAAKATLAEIQTRGKALKAELETMPEGDVAEVEAKLADAEGINRRVRVRKERAQLEAELNEHVERSEALTKTIEDIDAAKKTALEQAEYPVKGLEVTDEGLFLGGVPFSQASQAQQLKVSAAIGLALNPKLKVLSIKDGALLDDESLAELDKLARDHDAHVLVEVVGNREAATVIIEDGEVAGPADELPGISGTRDTRQPAGLDS
jgi:hypothetical protein